MCVCVRENVEGSEGGSMRGSKEVIQLRATLSQSSALILSLGRDIKQDPLYIIP